MPEPLAKKFCARYIIIKVSIILELGYFWTRIFYKVNVTASCVPKYAELAAHTYHHLTGDLREEMFGHAG